MLAQVNQCFDFGMGLTKTITGFNNHPNHVLVDSLTFKFLINTNTPMLMLFANEAWMFNLTSNLMWSSLIY